MLLRFQRPADAEPFKFENLADVKSAVAPQGSPFKQPVTSLIGAVMVGDLAVDARWVASITLSDTPYIQIMLRVPSPLPKYPDAGSDYFELVLRCEKEGQWRVTGKTLPWFKDSASSISGPLGEWLAHKGSELLSLEKKTFPLKDLGVCTEQPESNVYFMDASFGLVQYVASAGKSLAIVCFPFNQYDASIPNLTKFKSVALARLQDLVIEPSKNWRERPVVVIAPLAPVASTGGTAARSPWVTILQWRKHGKVPTDPPDKPTVISAATLFERVWTRAVRYASIGNRAVRSGQPWWPLPQIKVDDKSPEVRPLFLFATPGPTARDTRLIGVRLRGPNPAMKYLTGVMARFSWVAADTVPGLDAQDSPVPGIGVASSDIVLTCEHPLEPISGWQDDKDSLGKSRLSLATAAQLAELAGGRADAKDPDHLASWGFVSAKVINETQRWLSFGSVEIQFESGLLSPAPKPGDPPKRDIECILRGQWDVERCDVYPELRVNRMPCRMRLSSTGDDLPADLVAAFDSINRTEDDLHRPTAPIVGSTDNSDAARKQGVKGYLTVRVKAERGRDAVIELRLQRDYASELPDAKRLYIRSRPFTFARVSPPQFDPEAGTDFAYWRSDDSEGAQWRLPDADVELDLPPQTVAEEMERGNRFWDDEKTSYIIPTQPLNYRFSPPTSVVVRPSKADRRYNKNANNLSAILDNARVEAFRTELLYPIQVEFLANRDGDPAVDLGEVATFVGKPAPNLPALDVESKDATEARRLTENIFPDDLAEWFSRRLEKGGAYLAAFKQEYDALRWMHSANRAQFVSRVAQYHVYDPYRPQQQLALSRGVSARFRQPPAADPAPPGSMPPIMKPLPKDLDLTAEEKTGVARFLRNGQWGDPEKDGALRAGAIHTMEFASELMAVFRDTNAVEVFIDQLAFSVLGGTGAASVSFDEGRTTFSVEIADGQVWRIRKIRIGRIAIFWNKAKHVIVYERTVIPSQQFEGEQAPGSNATRNDTFGWPILRKTEEYIEPIERVRNFADEADADINSTAFAKALEFPTPRIYVNGAWGRDCKRGPVTHGYEIPLWNRADTSGFYPKPPIAMVAHAGGGEVSCAWQESPEELYFYTNTEAGTGADSDAWDAQPGVDLPANGPARPPMFLASSDAAEQVLDRSALPDPRLGGARRKRFDLPVYSDGPADLQHSRGETQVLATALDVLSFARTTATSVAESTDALKQIQSGATASSEIAALEEQVKGFLSRLPSIWVKYQFDCARLADYLDAEARKLFDELDGRVATAIKLIPPLPNINVDQLKARLRDEILHKVLPPTDVVPSLTKELAALLARIDKLSDEELKKHAEELQRQAAASWQPLDVLLKAAHQKVTETLTRPLELAKNDVDEVIAELAALAANVDALTNAAANKIKDEADKVKQSATALEQKVRKVRAPQLNTVLERLVAAAQAASQLADAVAQFADEAVRKKARDKVVGPMGAAKAALEALSASLKELITKITDKVYQEEISAAFLEIHRRVSKGIVDTDAWTANKVRETVKALLADVGPRAGKVATLLDDQYLAWRQLIGTKFGAAIDTLTTKLADAAQPLLTLVTEVHKAAQEELKKLGLSVSAKIDDLKGLVLAAIKKLKDEGCDALEDVKKKVEGALKETADKVKEQVTQAALSIIDSDTADRLAALAVETKDTAGKGLKLVKAIASVPELPHLTFNANRVEYLFDDVKKQIETSPFAARLREIDSGLKELGLAVPVNALANQLLPIEKYKGNFNKVFRDFGGIDFRKLLDKFKLPGINSENIKVVHGVDAATRTAWAKATVKADYPQANDLFAIGPLAVRMSGMSLRAQSDVRVALDGTRSTETTGQLRGTWVLNFKGAELVTFHDVTVTLDGGKFHVNVAPNNIVLHPSLKFISDIAKKIGDKIPPCIEVVRDSRGLIVGARANLSTIISKPPPMPPVTIGPLLLVAGLGLELQKGVGFVVGAHISVGTKTAPIFVQISYLGGGMFLESEARFVDGKIGYRASLGLALGSMQSFNVGGVARGSYSLLLFAYAQFESGKGGSLRAGFSISGSARILGIANAYLLLLLEVVHEEGSSTGMGLLDVSIDISRFYTLHVRKQVERKL
jgi:hypothetical protein